VFGAEALLLSTHHLPSLRVRIRIASCSCSMHQQILRSAPVKTPLIGLLHWRIPPLPWRPLREAAAAGATLPPLLVDLEQLRIGCLFARLRQVLSQANYWKQIQVAARPERISGDHGHTQASLKSGLLRQFSCLVAVHCYPLPSGDVILPKLINGKESLIHRVVIPTYFYRRDASHWSPGCQLALPCQVGSRISQRATALSHWLKSSVSKPVKYSLARGPNIARKPGARRQKPHRAVHFVPKVVTTRHRRAR
jgi:hypothetical protein